MAGLNPNFIRKVLNNPPFTDTEKYRYFVATERKYDCETFYYRTKIERIELDKLDTTDVYDKSNYKCVWCSSWRIGGSSNGQQG